MSRKRRIIGFILILLLVLIVALCGTAFWFLQQLASVGAGYCAKRLASGIFVAGRTAESVASEELGFVTYFDYEVDEANKTVTAWCSPWKKVTAVYREGLGVALALDGDVAAIKRQARPDLIPDLSHLAEEPWPVGDAPSGKPQPEGIDQDALDAAVDSIMATPGHRTRAVIVVYKDEIVAERYAEPYGPEQRFPAWSMTKSITHALCGIASAQGKIDIHHEAPVPEWQGEGNARSKITIDMMLRMSSGLKYNEHDYIPPVDLTTMLFECPDAARFGMKLPLSDPPDTVWNYSSPTTNILSWILRQAYGDDAYYALPYKELFGKIGMRSAFIEADASGTYVGSSFFFATARDFIRFGLLYMHDGVWQSERILPEGWVEYARTTTPTAPAENYGAHWWRPSIQEHAAAKAQGITLPEDTFHAGGFEGQKMVVIPSREIVILRLALAYFKVWPPYDNVCDILEALPAENAS